MAEADKPNPYEKLALLKMVTHAHAQADAYFEMIGAAAALAANQVRDVRLEHLEKGASVSAADVVVELLLAVALQYVGASAVAAITKSVMTRVLTTRRALLLVGARTEVGDQVAATYRAANFLTFTEVNPVRRQRMQELLQDVKIDVNTILRVGGPKELYSDIPFEIADKATTVVFHAARQVPQRPPRYTRLSPRDSPGVAVLDNVALFVTRQKVFNRIVFDELAHTVLLDLLGRDDALMLIRHLGAYSTSLYGSESLPEIKQRYKLFFEACIWAQILYPPPPLARVPPILDIGKRGADLTAYLLARIVNQDTGQPFGELVRGIPPSVRRRPDEATNEFFVLQSLLDYFKELRETTAQLELRLPPAGKTEWHRS
jgi:hypothetical protein